MSESGTVTPKRRRRLGWAVAAGALIAGICASFAFQIYESFRPVDGGLDRTRWMLRERLTPPRTDAKGGSDWTLIDLEPSEDATGSDGRHPRRGRGFGGPPTPDPDKERLLGGASSVFAAPMVERMVPGVTYEFSIRTAPGRVLDPDARLYLARAMQRPDQSVIPISAQAIAGRLGLDGGPHHQIVSARVRYTATRDDAGSPLFAHIDSRAAHLGTIMNWGRAHVLAYPPASSPRVRDMRLERIWSGGIAGVLSGAVVALVFGAPAAQLITLVFLLLTQHRGALPDGPWIRLLLVLGLAVAPILEILAWTAITAEDWQGQRGPGYWRYVWTSTRALVWLPWFAAASLLVAAATIVGPRWRRARLVAGVLVARAIVSATFMVAALLLQSGSALFGSGVPLSLFSVFPAATAVNDLLFGHRLVARAATDSTGKAGLRAWLLGWLVTLGSQLLLALGAYARLATERPSTDCFVVTAAAQGHPYIVGSWVDPGGRTVNTQLETLRQLEARIRAAAPRLHRRLRAVYDRVGPVAAGWIRGPWRADLAYLALKPLEWIARAERMISRGTNPRKS